MLCIVSALGMRAQTWTASEVGEGYAVLYNVGTGQFLTRGNGWNTQASIGGMTLAMPVELKAVGSNYIIRTAVNNDAYGLENLDGGTVYTDQSRNKQSTWTFTQVGTDNGPVYNIVSADNHGGGAGAYLTAGVNGTIVTPGTDGTIAGAKWKIFLYTDDVQAKHFAAMDDATETNPVDVSIFIGDAGFGDVKNIADHFWTMQSSNYNPNGGDVALNPVAESWRAAFTLSQTITVPNGYYRLRAQGFIREYSETGADYPVVYINEATKPFIKMKTETAALGTVSAYFVNGDGSGDNIEYYWTDWTDVVTVTGKSITVGVKGTRTDTWCAWDNFQLQYLGPIDLSEFIQGLANAVAAAQAYENQLPAAVYAPIATAIEENNKTYEDADGYSAAIVAINNAVAQNATAAIIADYSRYQSIKTEALAVASETDTEEADNQVEAATTTAAIDAAIATLRAAFLGELYNVTVPADPGWIEITNVMIDNPTVSQNVDGWNADNVVRAVSWGTGPTTNFGETEFYQSTFDFNQTIALNRGTWEFGVTGFHRAGNHSTYFYAGEDKILVPGVGSDVVNSMAEAKTYFDNGNGKVALKFIIESDQNVKIGILNQDTETDRWTIFRNFTLKYYGAPDYSVYDTQWAELVAEANAAKANTVNANVTGSELTNLNTAIADAPDGSSKANYIEKIDALQAALQAFNAAAPSYDKYVAYKNETTTLFGSDLSVAAPTTAAEALVAIQNLNIAQYNKVASDYPFSLTSKIGDFSTWEGTATHGADRTPHTPNSLDWEHWSGVTHPYYEQCADGYGNDGGWTIQYTKTTTLPAGSYVVKVAARSSLGVTSSVTCTALPGVSISLPCAGNNTRGINTDGEASWNEEDTFISTGGKNPTVGGTGAGWQWRFLPFKLETETEVTMTFYAEANGAYQWMSIADGELLSATNVATAVTYNDAEESTIEDVDVANVTITRTVKEGLNTVVLPFDCTLGQVEAAFGTGAEVYAYSETGDNPKDVTINFNKVNAGTISANVPVLVKATVASTEQVFEGVEVVAPTADVKAEGANFDYVGVYAPMTVATGDYFVSGGKLYKSAGATNLKGFRAYLKDKNPETTEEVKLYIDGVATAISEINADVQESGLIYNLAGQRVSKATKGIYVINGRKVVVK